MSDAQQPQVDAWLRRHKVENLVLTPLVAARIAVRDRTERVGKWLFLVLVAVLLTVGVVLEVVADWSAPEDAWSPVLFGVTYVLINVVTGVRFWLQRRGDLRIARGLRERVTRAEAVDLGTLLGGGNLRVMTLVYGGGVVVGAASAVVTTAPEGRLMAVSFVVGTVLCAGIVIGLFTDVVRRPAIADDEPSLRADDLLRQLDAKRALEPYPAILATVAAFNAGGSVLLWVFLGYAAAAVWAWGHTSSPTAAAGVTPGVWP